MEEESSAERRERLLALRSAASASASPAPSAPAPAQKALLPDPILASAAPEMSPQTSRFDYYTNPAAAFSGSKRKSPDPYYANATFSSSTTPPPPPRFDGLGSYASNASHPPAYQHHIVQSPGQSPFEMARSAQLSSPWRSPMQFQTPVPGYRGTPPSDPASWNPRTASPTRGYYPSSSRFGFAGSNVGRGGSPAFNPGPRGSPHSYSGRGRGLQYSSSPGPRGSGGRGGLGFQNRPGWQERRSYYSKSMVEDPWQDLQPIIGNILKPVDGAKSWLPESLSVKKEKSDQGGSKLNSELSLAEYLDMSFNETVGET